MQNRPKVQHNPHSLNGGKTHATGCDRLSGPAVIVPVLVVHRVPMLSLIDSIRLWRLHAAPFRSVPSHDGLDVVLTIRRWQWLETRNLLLHLWLGLPPRF